MLPIDPPLAALHGQRLDHSGALAHGMLNAAEHLTTAVLRLQAHTLERFMEASSQRQHALPAMAALAAITDDNLQAMGVDLVKEQIHIASDVGTRWIALGEWHQHGLNALWSHWLERVGERHKAIPMFAGAPVLQKMVESADSAVSGTAAVAVQATEVLVEQAEQVEALVRPARRAARK